MQIIPESFNGSAALQFIQSRGWDFKVSTEPNIELETCPYCKKTGYGHCYMEIHGPADDAKSRDSLHQCHKCGKGGNLFSLKQHLGVAGVVGVESRKEWSGGTEAESLPDIEKCHQALLEDADAMDYFMNGRGFSREVIEQQKLGIVPKRYFRETGEVKAIVYPYLVNGNCVFVHYRTLPTMPISENKVPKAFSSPRGWDVPLYNQEILLPGLKEVIMVEGEPNCIASMDHGITNICGVPGANIKKAEWIDILDKLELERIYICYDKDKVGQREAQALASRIGVERCWKITLPDFQVTTDEGVTRPGKDLNEWFVEGGGTREAFEKLKGDAVLFDVDGVASSKDSIDEFLEDLEGNGVEPKYKTAWPDLNKFVGFEDGDVIDILAPEKVGKGGRLSTPVLTPTGWVQMGDLKVGDSLVSIDGKPSSVTGVFPRGKMPFYRVTFSDGRSTDTTADHLWRVHCTTEWQGSERSRVYTTDCIKQEYHSFRTRERLYIPLILGEFGNNEPLPLDPWFLGVLIGDGCLVGNEITFSSADEEIVSRMSNLANSYGKEVVPRGKYDYRILNKGDKWLVDTLKEQGIHGHRAESKFIPKSYLQASRGQRLELLRGLLDTDGTAGNRFGTISYCSVSEQLAKDVQYLVRSLGGISRISNPQKKCFRYKGELRTGQPAYIVSVLMPDRENLFTVQRKLDRVKERIYQPRLTFKSIERVGEDEAVCIAVSHPSKLYITDDFIVTHNTTFALNLVENMVDTYGDDGVIICLEMARKRLARKYVSFMGGVEDNIPKSIEEAAILKEAFMKAIPLVKSKVANREGDLLFCSPRYGSKEDIFKLIVEIIRRYGVKWIVLDNLQLLADTTPRGKSNRVEHLTEISKALQRIAKEYNVNMVRILQPHRIPAGQMVSTDNVDGSSQIAKDCDCMITLHREKANQVSKEMFETMVHVESDMSFSPNLLVTVGLSRYSSGGYTTLVYDGARSTVKNRDDLEKAMVSSEVSKDVGYENQLKALNIALAPAVPTTPAQEGGVYEGEIMV